MEEKAASKEAEEQAYFEADHIEYREESQPYTADPTPELGSTP